MRVHMLKMRKRGIDLPKKIVFDRFNRPKLGTLTIGESNDQGLHRMAMRAHFLSDSLPIGGDVLLDCRVLWVFESRMMFTGFETCNTHEGVANYAQSWLGMLDEPPPLPEGR